MNNGKKNIRRIILYAANKQNCGNAVLEIFFRGSSSKKWKKSDELGSDEEKKWNCDCHYHKYRFCSSWRSPYSGCLQLDIFDMKI